MKTKTKIWLITGVFFLGAAGLLFLYGDTAGETGGGPSDPGAADEIITVYITNTGAKYHREDCVSLRRSKTAVSLADALESGYEACAVCNPPAPGAVHQAETPARTDRLYRVNLAGLGKSSAADHAEMVQAEVVSHVDGDTVRVRIPGPPDGLDVLETIRLIGVDTPETVHPSRPVEAFGREASEFTKSRLLGKTVYLAFDWDLRDRYGRLLAYIYTLSDDAAPTCFNALLIREGYGHAYTRFAFQFMEEFRALEGEARKEKLGLWGN
jgi:micrococcal nuclease